MPFTPIRLRRGLLALALTIALALAAACYRSDPPPPVTETPAPAAPSEVPPEAIAAVPPAVSATANTTALTTEAPAPAIDPPASVFPAPESESESESESEPEPEPEPEPETETETETELADPADEAAVAEEKDAEETKPPERPSPHPALAAPYTPAQLGALKPGLSLSDAIVIAGQPSQKIADEGGGRSIYKWSRGGTSFFGRFLDGKLVLRTGLLAADGSKVEDESEERKVLLTETGYNGVRQDMTLQEVFSLLDINPNAVSSAESGIAIYSWRDYLGSSFVARFEDDRLVRKTGMYVAPLEKDTPEEKEKPAAKAKGQEAAAQGETGDPKTEEPQTPPESADSEVEEGEAGGGRRAVEARAYAGAPAGEAMPPGEDEALPEDRAGPLVFETPPAGTKQVISTDRARVRVAGAARRQREIDRYPPGIAGRSYKPKAKLPKRAHSLRKGSYEIRFVNESASAVEIAVRSGKNGRDVAISAGASKSLLVDRGAYQVYYIYKDTPYELFGGDSINIDGQTLADVEVSLVSEGGGVSVRDYDRYGN